MTPSLDDLERRKLLAAFLKTRRARVAPQELGFMTNTRRRTPGLRREEVASLANVGIAWYTALEQAQDVHPSASILASIARVLQLTPREREHLFFLAGQFDPDISLSISEVPSPALSLILNSLSPFPAYLLDRLWNYVGWNQEAEELFDLTQDMSSPAPNLVWLLFADPKKRQLYPNWNEVACHVISEFRAEVEPLASHPEVHKLVHRLELWPEFVELWSTHPILATVDRKKILIHPDRGQLSFEYTTFRLAAQDSLRLIVYTPVT